MPSAGCFFRQSSTYETWSVIHDLLKDLAKYVCGDISFRLAVDKANVIPKTCYFSLAINHVQYIDGFGRMNYLYDHWYCKRCRTLGNLKHFFSLDLSSTAIKKLLDSTCSLYNLQILKLSFCKNLEELPLNLQHLEFGDTKVKKMPMHLGKLKNLQVLSSFYVGTTTEFGIQQLGELNLHGRLSIGELQNIQNPWDALAADLKNKIHLAELELEWNQNSDDLTKERDVFENLHPSKHLKKLSIRNYGDKQFPNIRYCGKLQFVYHLTALEMLTISGHSMEASTLERIGYILSNTSLELLFIDSCPNINISISHCYDFLINLEISNGCDSLTTFWLDLFPKLCLFDLMCRNLQTISQGLLIIISRIKKLVDVQSLNHFPILVALTYEKGKFDELLEDNGVKILIDPKALMNVIGTKMDFVYDKLRFLTIITKNGSFIPSVVAGSAGQVINIVLLQHEGMGRMGIAKSQTKRAPTRSTCRFKETGLTIRRHNMDASSLKTIGQIVSDTSLDFLHTYFSSNMNISMSHCYDFLLTLTINGGCDSNNFSARFVSKTPFA
ncbi:putative disease resistance RPP13-like protein 1 [Glycine soja]